MLVALEAVAWCRWVAARVAGGLSWLGEVLLTLLGTAAP